MDTNDLIAEFIRAMRTRRNLSPRTLKAYESDLRAFERLLGRPSWDSLTPVDLQGYVSLLEERGLRPTSIRRKLASAKVFFRFLRDEGHIENVPFWKSCGRFRVPKQLPRVLPRQDILRILSVAHSRAKAVRGDTAGRRYAAVRNLLVVELLFSLGLRIDELTRLNIDDIDLRSGAVLVFGKGRKERLLYLSSSEVKDIIGEYLVLRDSVCPADEAFFVNRLGNRLGNGSVGRIFGSLSEEAGVQRRYTPHCLRHSMATMLIENGADVRSVQEILGHSSISTTEIYIHVSRQRKKEVLGRFNARNDMHLLRP